MTLKMCRKHMCLSMRSKGLILRHIWRNIDDPDDILFIFTTSDLNCARKSIEMVHEETLKENPNANLHEMLFLKSE